ncbi:hypothetical protein HJC23_009356 [Cyclotella cryptica]|uniref:Uncharacterized protein n=1 Tax=Cyclotella cryptica TaxID=29204 RepID=A0ABD3QTC9_9STRA
MVRHHIKNKKGSKAASAKQQAEKEQLAAELENLDQFAGSSDEEMEDGGNDGAQMDSHHGGDGEKSDEESSDEDADNDGDGITMANMKDKTVERDGGTKSVGGKAIFGTANTMTRLLGGTSTLEPSSSKSKTPKTKNPIAVATAKEEENARIHEEGRASSVKRKRKSGASQTTKKHGFLNVIKLAASLSERGGGGGGVAMNEMSVGVGKLIVQKIRAKERGRKTNLTGTKKLYDDGDDNKEEQNEKSLPARNELRH